MTVGNTQYLFRDILREHPLPPLLQTCANKMQKFEINPTALPQNPKERDLAIKLYALQTLEQQSFMNQFHRHFHPFNPHTHRTAMALSLTYEPPEALQPITSPHALKKRDRS